MTPHDKLTSKDFFSKKKLLSLTLWPLGLERHFEVWTFMMTREDFITASASLVSTTTSGLDVYYIGNSNFSLFEVLVYVCSCSANTQNSGMMGSLLKQEKKTVQKSLWIIIILSVESLTHLTCYRPENGQSYSFRSLSQHNTLAMLAI